MRFAIGRTILATATAAAALTTPVAASAAQFVIDDLSSPYAAGESWGMLADYNTGTAAITTTAAHLGNGSIELTGDMTRVQTGYQLGAGRTNMGLARNVTGLTFDWRVASDSSNTDYTPALRLLVHDGRRLNVFVWGGLYNGVNTNATDTWYSTSTSDLFWHWDSVAGETMEGGHYKLMTLSDWLATMRTGTYVTAISVGAGAGAGRNYHAFVDNVQLFQNGALGASYNFETTGAVPEPASWLMLILGFGALGFAMRSARPATRSVRIAAR